MGHVHKTSFALPVVRAILPFIGRAAARGAIGLGASSLLGKIFGGKIKRRKRRKRGRKFKKRPKRVVYRRYRRYVK